MMRPALNLKIGSGKGLISSPNIHYETIDIPLKYPVFNKILNTNDVKLLDLSNLQVETEKIMCLLGYRMINLSSFIEGKPYVNVNGVSPSSLNGQSNCFSSNLLSSSTDQQCGNNSNSTKTEELIVKSSPEKPLAFIIAQNRPSTRRSSGIGKRKKPNDMIQIGMESDKLATPVTTNQNNYEIPNKFWELMEPYCAEINEDHIKTLDAMIQSYENDMIYYEMPELPPRNDTSENNSFNIGGPVSNLRKNLMNNGDEDGGDNHRLNGFVDEKNGMDLSNLLKKIDIEIRRPLSQKKALEEFPRKFVDSFVKESENFIKLHQLKVKDAKLDGSMKIVQPSKSIAKQLKVSNSFKLERHIKKTVDDLGLCNFNLPFVPKLKPEQGLKNDSDQLGIAKSNEADIIDPLVLNSDSDYIELNLPQFSNSRKRKIDFRIKEDKIQIGLSRRQAELKLVSESNLGMLKRLMVAAKRDCKRQEIERRLAVADADVIECYNIIESYRPTHKVPLKKDRDAAYKALKERKKILKELESFDTEFL